MFELGDFQRVIKEKCGLVFDDTKNDKLRDAIKSRLADHAAKTVEDYYSLLISNKDEFHRLVDLLTINETYFMREPFHLRLMTDKLLPPIIAGRNPGERLKILCAGCSTGEEPYSVSMTLMEKYGDTADRLFRITGFDIDSGALDAARRGVYSKHSFRGFDPGLIAKYFDQIDSVRYALKPSVKQKVEFIKLNFMDIRYPDSLKGADIIFYRNVSIYFDAPTQRMIFGRLADLLNDGGYLIVSSTETLSHNLGILTLMEIDGGFIFRKSEIVPIADRRHAAAGPRVAPAMPRPAVPIKNGASASVASAPAIKPPAEREMPDRRLDTHGIFDRALACVAGKRFDEALTLVEQLLVREPGFTKAFALQAGILANMRRFDEADAVCQRSIEADQWGLESYLLRGLIAHRRDDSANAVRRFKEALYVDSSSWVAHFYLAEIYAEGGETELARREYAIVVNLLGKAECGDHGLTYFPLSFSAEHILHLCRHNLSKLSGMAMTGTNGNRNGI